MCGGWSETKAVTSDTPKIQKICNDVKSLLKHRNYAEFEAVKYRDRSDEGRTYYLFKVRVGKGERDYIHLYSYEPSKGGFEVHCVQENKTKDDLLSCC